MIDGKGFLISSYSNLVQTTSIETGKEVPIQISVLDSLEIVHIALYLDLLGNGQEIANSDTYITYDKDQPVQIIDPHGFFSDVKVTPLKDGIKNKFLFTISFQKPMSKSHIIFRAWDDHRYSNDVKILDALEVVEQQTPILAPQKIQNQTFVKSNLTTSINFSQNQGADLMGAIKEWSGYSPNAISDSELLDHMGFKGDHIPSWVMKTTKWVVNGQISQEDFIAIIKFIYMAGILK
jgi:hypothetical protein